MNNELRLTVEQQIQLNVNRYDVDEVSKMFSKKELAKTLVATTCWSESINQQYNGWTIVLKIWDMLKI